MEKDLSTLKTYFTDKNLQRCVRAKTSDFSGKTHQYRKTFRCKGNVFDSDYIGEELAVSIADTVSQIATELLRVR